MQDILANNLLHDERFVLKPQKELYRFLSFTGNMLPAFPIGMLMRKQVRKNPRLNHIIRFEALRSVRGNIEKGSFAYDTILFKISPWKIFFNKTHLANLVCLAILFGDEFIDGLATEYGKKNIQQLLYNSEKYYLQYKHTEKGYELYYEIDIREVIPPDILQQLNAKYHITYDAFYDHLQFLLAEMNHHLQKLKTEQAAEAAQLICVACNKCFDTYKTDISEFDESYDLQTLLAYQKTKDEDIVQVLLQLRAVLLEKNRKKYQQHYDSWSSMIRSMQLYDDMEDAAGDCDFQMNMLNFFAKTFFEAEWQWLQKNKEALQNTKGLQLHGTISLHMPGSCMLVLQYAKNIANNKLSWVQKKIQNYLWRKNWLGLKNESLQAAPFAIITPVYENSDVLLSQLIFIQRSVFQATHTLITEEMKWAFMVDIVLLNEGLKKKLFSIISFKEKYGMLSCYLEFPVNKKAAIAKKFFAALSVTA